MKQFSAHRSVPTLDQPSAHPSWFVTVLSMIQLERFQVCFRYSISIDPTLQVDCTCERFVVQQNMIDVAPEVDVEGWELICPQIGPEKTFLIRLINIMYGLIEFNKLSVFCPRI